MKLQIVLLSIVIIILGSVGVACKEGRHIDSESGLNDMVIATVGDSSIMLSELLEMPQIYQIIDDSLIKREVAKQEMAKQGLIVDMDAVQEQLDQMIESNGGWDTLLDNAGETMPRALIPRDIRNYFIYQQSIKQLMELHWDTVLSVEREQEFQERWANEEERIRDEIATKNEIDPSEVTTEMALDYLNEKFKEDWMNIAMMDFQNELVDSYDVNRILFNYWDNEEPVNVPLIEGTGDEHGEEGAEEHDEGHDDAEANEAMEEPGESHDE